MRITEEIPATESAGKGKQYVSFGYTFNDTWKGEEVEIRFRFAKPNQAQIKQMQKMSAKDPGLASRNLLVNTVHPEDKAAFLAAAEEYPAVVSTLSTGIIRAVGVADLGN